MDDMDEQHYMDNEAVIHLYGQGAWHDEASIVCNLKGLQALKDALEEALRAYVFDDIETVTCDASVIDGEGYPLRIICEPSIRIKARRLPYTDELFKDMYQPTPPTDGA